MSSMTGLNEIALYLWVGLDSFFFPLLILQLGAGLLGLRLSPDDLSGTLFDMDRCEWIVERQSKIQR